MYTFWRHKMDRICVKEENKSSSNKIAVLQSIRQIDNYCTLLSAVRMSSGAAFSQR